MPYAERTKVPVERSKAEIERLVVGKGARSFISGHRDGRAVVVFELSDRRVQFSIPMQEPKGGTAAADDRQARANRERWRALLLAIKSKIVAVESGVETFEEAFLAHIVISGGGTVGDHLLPTLDAATNTGRLPPLLPAGKQ